MMRTRNQIVSEQRSTTWIYEHGWSASVRFTFRTGRVPIEWYGDKNEWALSYGRTPSLAEVIKEIKSAGVSVVDLSVQRKR
jgi:hypothetical protein